MALFRRYALSIARENIQAEFFTHNSRTPKFNSLLRDSSKSKCRNVTFYSSLSTSKGQHPQQQPLDNIYNSTFERSVTNPDDFWAEAAYGLTWHKKWDKVIDDTNSPFTKWFVGGELNTCYNAVDRHTESGHGDLKAIIHDSPVTGTINTITYSQLLIKVKRMAGVLHRYGVRLGDRVVIYMPMIPEAVVTMLACARIGAVHCLVFGGFASKELSVRIDHSKPRLVVTANCGVEPGRVINYKQIVDDAVAMGNHKPDKCIVYNRPGFDGATMISGRDLDYVEACDSAHPVDPVPVPATDPIYILHTSGTTGIPKAVVRPSAGYAVALQWSMKNIYGMNPDEVWWSASDLGWVVGHSYIAYAPLLNRNTTVLFEGKPVGTPDPGTYFRVLKEHDVSALFLAPTALRSIRQQDAEIDHGKKYLPLSKLRYIYVAGEHCDNETRLWTTNAFQKPVLDHWWQTESGWPMTATLAGLGMTLDPPHGVTGKPVPSWNVKIFSLDGTREAETNELGQIVVKLPLPPGAMSTLLDNDKKFIDTYFSKFPGYYDAMDSGYRDENGYIAVLARIDDVINVAGHRLSAASLEEAVLGHQDVADVAVIGVADKVKGHMPMCFCALKAHCDKPDDQITSEVSQIVREKIGPIASFKHAVIVPGLPKTRSGKIARHTLCEMVEGRPYKVPVTIQDAAVYPEIEQVLRKRGLIGPITTREASS